MFCKRLSCYIFLSEYHEFEIWFEYQQSNSANDEELFSSPPLGARTHGLPMMTDWKSLSASSGPIHTDLFAMESDIFGQWLSPDETCLGMRD